MDLPSGPGRHQETRRVTTARRSDPPEIAKKKSHVLVRDSDAQTLFTGFTGMSSKFAPLPYIATPEDDSLEAYLIEALYLLELRFQSLDEDGAGSVVVLILRARKM